MLYQVKTLFLIFILIVLSSQTKASNFPKINEIARYDQGTALFDLDETGFLGSLGLSESHNPLDLNLSHYVLKKDSECGNFAASLIQGHISLDDPKIQLIENQSASGDLEAGCKMVFIEAKRYNFDSFINYLRTISRKKHPLIMSLHANHYLNNFSIQGRKNGKDWVLSESESLLKEACSLKSAYACSQLFLYYYTRNQEAQAYKDQIKNVLKNAKNNQMLSPFLYAAYFYSLNSNEKDQKISKRLFNYIFKKEQNLIELINLIQLHKLNYFLTNPLMKPVALEDLKFWSDKAFEQSFYGAEYFQAIYELHLGEDKDLALNLLKKAFEKGYNRASIDYISHLIINEKKQNEDLIKVVENIYSKEPKVFISILGKIKNHLNAGIMSANILSANKNESEREEIEKDLQELSDTYEFWMKQGAKLRDIYSLRSLAYFYHAKNEYEKAMKLLRFIESKNKQSSRDLFALAFLYSLKENETEVKSRLEKCTKSIYPPCIIQYLSLYQDEISETEKEYLLSLAAILGNKEAFFPLSISFSKIQDEQNAFSWFKEATKYQPYLFMQAYRILLNLGETDRAIKVLEESRDYLLEKQGNGAKNTKQIQDIEAKIQEIKDGVN